MQQPQKSSGELTNKELEEDLAKKKGTIENEQPYIGSQDTGDNVVRPFGTPVQQRDGLPKEGDKEDNNES